MRRMPRIQKHGKPLQAVAQRIVDVQAPLKAPGGECRTKAEAFSFGHCGATRMQLTPGMPFKSGLAFGVAEPTDLSSPSQIVSASSVQSAWRDRVGAD